MKYGLGLLLTLLSFNTWAGHFICEFEDYRELNDEGEFIESDTARMYIGEKFTIDRDTADLGGVFSNSTYPTRQVIDKGGPEMYFKAIWIGQEVLGHEPSRHVTTLTVDVTKRSREKPFLMLDGMKVISGTCVD